MSAQYEIVIYESQSIYELLHASSENVLQKYLRACKKYVSPEYITEECATFFKGEGFISYADQSGGDKPAIVMLVGNIGDDLTSSIREGMRTFYIKSCEFCGKDMPLKDWLCKLCRNAEKN